MHVWLFSTHASQEFDLVRMWAREGCRVSGIFDCYSKQRPKVKGITDVASIPGRHQVVPGGYKSWSGCEEKTAEWSDLVERDRNLQTDSTDFADIDVFVLMEVRERAARVEHYAKMAKLTVLQCFGQESDDEDKALVPVLKKYANAHLACYSPAICDRYIDKGVPYTQVHLIRFGVYPEEYPPQGAFIGDLNVCLCAHNSIHLRGEGCGWEIYKAISAGLPFVLVGKDTERVGGMGEQNYMALKWWYARATCYLSMGTKPAPYTMTPIEAMMSGCPLIFWDNGSGIRDEEWASSFLISDDIQQIRNYVALMLDPKYSMDDLVKAIKAGKDTEELMKMVEKFLNDERQLDIMELSRASRNTALRYFDAHKIGKQWLKLFIENR